MKTKDAATLTDFPCQASNADFASLVDLNHAVSTYQLRSDVDELVQVSPISTPVLDSALLDIDLTNTQCAETFKFLLSSGERLGQMTKTYHDVEVVTKLLEEKERDLELAAHIGQSLLSKNKVVSQQNELLEERLACALEEASQLRHEITQKERLLDIYVDTTIESDGSQTPTPPNSQRSSSHTELQKHVDNLHRKIKQLEVENESLLSEQTVLEDQTSDMSQKEENLVSETLSQINYLKSEIQQANEQIRIVTSELSQRNDEALRQQDNIRLLLDEMVHLQDKHKNLSEKHEDLQQSLNTAYNSQFKLTLEVHTLEDKYQEVLSLLDETREESSSKSFPPRLFPQLRSTPNLCSFDDDDDEDEDEDDLGLTIPFHKSLAAELQQDDVTSPSRNSVPSQQPHAVVTSRANAGAASHPVASSKLAPSAPVFSNLNDPQRVLSTTEIANKRTSEPGTSTKLQNNAASRRPSSIELRGTRPPVTTASSLASSGLTTPLMGRPGVPGTNDLEYAVKKLSVIKERMKMITALNASAKQKPAQDHGLKEEDVRVKSQPKLRAVKPMEGSMTLGNWKKMANDRGDLNLNSMLQVSPPGVVLRSHSNQSLSQQQQPSPLCHAAKQPAAKHNAALKGNSATTALDRKKTISFSTPCADDSGSTVTSCGTPSMPQATMTSRATSPHARPNATSQVSGQIRTVKSSPHLMGLAAVLAPTLGAPQLQPNLLLRNSPTFRLLRHATSSHDLLRHATPSSRDLYNASHDWSDLHGSSSSPV